MNMEEYPGVSSFTDRHGKKRWRYRGKGRGAKQINLPGDPGEAAFEAAYAAAVQGIKPVSGVVKKMPGAALPKPLAMPPANWSRPFGGSATIRQHSRRTCD